MLCLPEYYAASKETVALAEERFLSNSHEWQFDNAWQEMLNHATIKVMEAETQKTESGQEHQRRALIFNAAEQKVQQLEEKLRRHIIKSRPYFEENQICQDQLKTQKARIAELQSQIQVAKAKYSTALRSLENISEDIHRQRGDLPPQGPREPGVGAELSSPMTEEAPVRDTKQIPMPLHESPDLLKKQYSATDKTICAAPAISDSEPPSGCQSESEGDDAEDEEDGVEGNLNDMETESVADDEALESLRQKVKVLAIRPVEGGEGKPQEQSNWEYELTETINKLDHLMMIRELKTATSSSAPTTPQHRLKDVAAGSLATASTLPPVKMLKGGGQLPATNSSLNELSVKQLMPFVLPSPPAAGEFCGGASASVTTGYGPFGPLASGSAAATGTSTKDKKRKLSI